MVIHEEPSPNSVSSPVSTAKDSRCYTVEDLMEMLLLSRPTVYRLLKQNEFRWFKVSGAYRISKAALKHGSMMALLNAILLFDILNISREICYSLAGMRNPG